MAPKVHAANAAPKAPPQWGEREVRRLLRGLRRPHTLEMEPLAQFLCDAYGIDRPYEASVQFVCDTFVDKGLVGKRLYDLVHTCDIEASETLLGAASEMGVSPRQFFRYRREAIVALAAHANNLGLAHPTPTSPVEELARLLGETDPSAATRVYDLAAPTESATLHRIDALLNAGTFFDDALLEQFGGTDRLRVLIKVARTCYLFGNTRSGDALLAAIRARMVETIVEDREVVEFELLHLQYVRALHREDAARCMQLANAARRAANGDEGRTIVALLIGSESAIRAGDLLLAEQTLTAAEGMILPRKQLRQVSILVAARAAIAFLRDDLPRALACMNSAKLALPDRPLDALTINAFIGRISLAMGAPWRASPELLEVTEPLVRTITPSAATGLVALDGSTRRFFQRLYLKAIDLRGALAAGELDSIDEIVETLALTRLAGYRALESLALALLAQWRERTGARDEAQRDAVAAWEILTDLGDAFMAHDLFYRAPESTREFGAVDLDATFLVAFYRALSAHFSDSPLVAAADGGARDEFWRSALLGARAGDESWSTHDEAFLALLAAGNPTAPRKQREAFVRAAARDLAVLLPAPERARFATTLTRRLSAFYDRLPGGDARAKGPHF